MTYVDLLQLTSGEASAFGAGAVGVVQVGAVEQHGPHLPLGTDSLITEALVRGAAERVAEPVLVAPPIHAGRSDHHLGFSGTISVPASVFAGLVEAHVAGFAGAGVARVALVSAHAGNFSALREIADRESPVDVRAYADVGRFLAVMAQAARDGRLDAPETDSHAGACETSMILRLLGEGAVREFSHVEGYTAAEPGWLERLGSEPIETLSATGVLGRPAGANAAAGERILEALTAELAGWLAGAFGLELLA